MYHLLTTPVAHGGAGIVASNDKGTGYIESIYALHDREYNKVLSASAVVSLGMVKASGVCRNGCDSGRSSGSSRSRT